MADLGEQTLMANDQTPLAYEIHGSSGPWVVLLHGWSGSRAFFALNAPALAASCRVLLLDQRHHGGSGGGLHGRHVARLAADLRGALAALDITDATVVGTSMGCAVIWSYIELFGTDRLAKAVFVDQAPLQNRAPGWELGSKGCYDEASLRRLQATLARDVGEVADGNAAGCLSLPVPAELLARLRSETLRCDGAALAELMQDHTQLDWRPLLPRIGIPCLNCVGGASGVFPPEGCLEVARLAPDCCSAVFDRANHWLYLEQPAEFNDLLLGFVARGNAGRPKLAHIA
ncbi:MAG: Alpha/Beta hydrolase protein [Monoraphidium minutum]|nr:MAG: Alpha/Beta hydrolase protein [Monoraphidium minutum]